jgi:hypothetical protein
LDGKINDVFVFLACFIVDFHPKKRMFRQLLGSAIRLVRTPVATVPGSAWAPISPMRFVSSTAIVQAEPEAASVTPAAEASPGKKGRRLGNNAWKRTKARLRQSKNDVQRRIEETRVSRVAKHEKTILQWRASKEYRNSFDVWKAQQPTSPN